MDAKVNKLRELLYTGTINDMERQFYAAEGGTGNDITQLEKTWLASLGYAQPHIVDARVAYWRSLGYTGAYNDLEQQFWNGYAGGPSQDAMLREDSGFILREDETYILREA
jgi:hypothetical protein